MLLKNTTELEKGAKTNAMLEAIRDLSSLDSIPSPRILDTHCSFKYLPSQHIEKKNKIVHIVRNPKDVCVSFYHHASKDKFTNFNGSWNDFFDLWMAGKCKYNEKGRRFSTIRTFNPTAIVCTYPKSGI